MSASSAASPKKSSSAAAASVGKTASRVGKQPAPKKSAVSVRRISRETGVSDNAIVTMYNKCAKITSVNRATFIPEAHAQIEEIADELLSSALSVMAYRNASTITAEDLICGGKARGYTFYGIGNFLSLQSHRRQQAASRNKKNKNKRAAKNAASASLPAAAAASSSSLVADVPATL